MILVSDPPRCILFKASLKKERPHSTANLLDRVTEKSTLSMAPELKLTYFDIRGRAEAIRLALHLADIPFTDERLPREEAMALIAEGSLPFHALPVLEVGGKLHAQSLALLRYVGKLGGLYPEDCGRGNGCGQGRWCSNYGCEKRH